MEIKSTVSSSMPQTPSGELATGRVASPALSGLPLVKYITSKGCIAGAWKKVKSNKGAPGIDGISVETFRKWIRPRWERIHKKLIDGSFEPMPVLRVEIPKESGGVRKLGIPRILDRVIMQSMSNVLTYEFNSTFSDSSFGYRPGCSVRMAVEQAQQYYKKGYKFQVDIDLEKFFDTVNHDVLMDKVKRKIKDKDFLKLLGKFLRAGVVVDGRLQPTRKGVPQGSPVSPILSNILLDDLDKELEKREHKFIRYADDLAVYVKSKRAGERVLASLTKFLERKLKVKVNTGKSRVSKVKDATTLGFHIHQKKLRAADVKVSKFKAELKHITRRCPGISIESRLFNLRKYAQGWMGHYGIGLRYDDAVEFDGWLRRRFRMCYWKQWKQPRKRIRELLKLGVKQQDAIYLGISRKSYWRLSKTLGTHSGLTNQYFNSIGLYSLRDQWCRIHYPGTPR